MFSHDLFRKTNCLHKGIIRPSILQVFLCQIIWSFYISFLYDIIIWIIFAKKKISKFSLHFFLKCTLYSHIFMQTDNAFYGSAQMLKFINEFTKPLNLQRNPKDTYSLHCFISQKSLTFYLFFTKYSVFLMVLRNK